MKSKDEKEGTELETLKRPSTELTVIDYGGDEGLGLENVTTDEFRIPILRILQALSPQCKPVNQGGIDGARPGMILNTSTGEVMDGETGFEFVPVKRDHNFVEYVPRDAGGGFVAIRPVKDEEVQILRSEQGQFGKLQVPGGTELTETRYLYGLMVLSDGDIQRGVVTFSSSQIKKYQAFMNREVGITYRVNEGTEEDPHWRIIHPPLWAHRWRVSTTYERNKKGEFYNWKLQLVAEPPIKARLRTDDPVYVQAREMFEMVRAGRARAAYEKDVSAGTVGADEEVPL